MKPEDYPEQDEVSEFARAYVNKITKLGSSVSGEDVMYGSNPYQSIGIHCPKNPSGSVFMFIHGGGWTTGYKEWNNFMAPSLLANNIIFVTVGYRLAPIDLFPAGLNDCVDAVTWVYKNIEKYGGDTSQIYLGGHSAGGHYASLISVSNEWQEQANVPLDVIRGCVPVSGVFLFGEGSGLTQHPRFLGKEGNGMARKASPILFVNKPTPKFFISYGDSDFPHLITQALKMEQALKKVGTKVTRLEMAGCDHLEAHLETSSPNGNWLKTLTSFMSI